MPRNPRTPVAFLAALVILASGCSRVEATQPPAAKAPTASHYR